MSGKKAFKGISRTAKKVTKDPIGAAIGASTTIATGGLDLIAGKALGATQPKADTVSPSPSANVQGQIEQTEASAAKEAATEAARRAAPEGGTGFQQTLLSGFAGGAQGDQLRKKTLLGS
jgi:hypothetical protein